MRKGASFADFIASLKALCEEIDKGRPRPLYLIHGGQEYFVEWAATNLLAHLLPGDSGKNSLTTFDFRQRDLGDAKPFLEGENRLFGLDSRRVLLLKNLPALGTEIKGSVGQFLADPPSGTITLATTCREISSSSALFKRFSEQGAILRAATIDSEGDAFHFLNFLATRNVKSKLKADQSAFREILARVGTEEPRQLVREMEKLSLYVGTQRAATLDDVQEMVTLSAPESAFALLAQIAEGNASQAIATLDLLSEQRTPHPIIIGAIGQELRRLLQGRLALDSGDINPSLTKGGFEEFGRAFNEEKRNALAQRFPSGRRDNLFLHHPYTIYRCLQQAQSLNRDALTKALAAVVEADYQLKTSPRPENQVLEKLILDLCKHMKPCPDVLKKETTGANSGGSPQKRARAV
jgi:DNA polymerase III delta subunit